MWMYPVWNIIRGTIYFIVCQFTDCILVQKKIYFKMWKIIFYKLLSPKTSSFECLCVYSLFWHLNDLSEHILLIILSIVPYE